MLTLNDGRKELYQWDTGRTATVDIDCDIVHFANLKYGESLAVEVKEGEVAIPNKLLMSGETIYCWAFVKDENGAYTKKEQTLDVEKRAKPSDYVYTETEVITIKTAVENALEEAKNSGEFKGDKGDKGDPGEKGDKGDKGLKGEKGDPFTYEDFTAEQLANLKGKDGTNGIDGYTPQKGIDYFTDEDIASLNIPSVDQTYTPDSENAQSGKAVAEAVAAKADKREVDKLKDDLANFDGEPELIENFVSNEDMDVFTRSEAPDGTPYDFKALFIECDIAGSSKEYQTLNFTSNLSTPMSFANATNKGRGVSIGLWLNKIKTVCLGYGGWRGTPRIYNKITPLNGTKYTAFSTIYQGESIKSFELNFNATVYSGTVIKIYGVKI